MRMSMPKAWYTAMQTPQYTDDRLPNLYTMHACLLAWLPKCLRSKTTSLCYNSLPPIAVTEFSTTGGAVV